MRLGAEGDFIRTLSDIVIQLKELYVGGYNFKYAS